MSNSVVFDMGVLKNSANYRNNQLINSYDTFSLCEK